MVVTVSLDLMQGGGGFGLAYVSKVAPSRNLGWVDQIDLGDLSNRENRITCTRPARAMRGTIVQEPLCRLTDNIHGDIPYSQRLKLSVLSCCCSRRLKHVLDEAPQVQHGILLSLLRPTRPAQNSHVLLVQPSESGPSPTGLAFCIFAF